MKLLLLVLFLLPLLSEAQVSENPSLPRSGNSINSLIPTGWHLLDSATGDLNKDKLNDLVLIIEADSTVQIMRKDAVEEYEWEGNPRILCVYLREKKGGYRFSVQADDLVLWSNEGGMMGDPFTTIVVERGSFQIHFYGGSSWRWGADYRFRFQEKEWYLIGATEYSLYLGTGEMGSTDYNLLTGDMEITTGYELVEEECLPCEDCENCPRCEECGECEQCTKPRITRVKLPRSSLPLLKEFDSRSWAMPKPQESGD